MLKEPSRNKDSSMGNTRGNTMGHHSSSFSELSSITGLRKFNMEWNRFLINLTEGNKSKEKQITRNKCREESGKQRKAEEKESAVEL